MFRLTLPRFLLLVAAAGLLALGGLLSAPALVRWTHGLEEPAALSRDAQAAALAVARAAVAKEAGWAVPAVPVAPELSRPAVHPVFVTVFAVPRPAAQDAPVGTWVARTGAALPLQEAIALAAADAGKQLKGVDADKVRIKVDISGPPRGTWLEWAAYLDVVLDPGRDGLEARTGSARGFVLPSWAVERGQDVEKMVGALRGQTQRRSGSLGLSRFRTLAVVEGTPDEPGPLPVYRGNVLLPDLTADQVRRSLTLAAEYLSRAVQADGHYCYNYLVVEDRCDSDYNLLRHAGSTYALFQMYRHTPTAEVLAAAERATGWLRDRVRTVEGDPSRAFMLEGDRAKLGAVGLTLLALVEREKALHDGQDRELMVKMGAFILSQQREDGFLASFFKWKADVAVPAENSIYYPGEALLGLLRLHDLDPQARWLEGATRTANFLAKERWRWGGVELYVPPDAWLAQALIELYVKQPDKELEEYGYRIVDAFADVQLRAEEGAGPDLAGGPAGGIFLPSSGAAGARNEGLTAAVLLARAAQEPEEEQRILALSYASAHFQLQQQFRPANSYWVPNPERVRGGIRGRADDQQVRIDHVQHNASGLLRVLAFLEGKP